MAFQVAVVLGILLVLLMLRHKLKRQEDRVIKEHLRAELDFFEQRYKASMKFNEYFLNNLGAQGSIVIGIEDKHYLLYSDEGQPVIIERVEKFSEPEKIFYGSAKSVPPSARN